MTTYKVKLGGTLVSSHRTKVAAIRAAKALNKRRGDNVAVVEQQEQSGSYKSTTRIWPVSGPTVSNPANATVQSAENPAHIPVTLKQLDSALRKAGRTMQVKITGPGVKKLLQGMRGLIPGGRKKQRAEAIMRRVIGNPRSGKRTGELHEYKVILTDRYAYKNISVVAYATTAGKASSDVKRHKWEYIPAGDDPKKWRVLSVKRMVGTR